MQACMARLFEVPKHEYMRSHGGVFAGGVPRYLDGRYLVRGRQDDGGGI